MEKIKVLFLCGNFNNAGVNEWVASMLANGLSQAGHHIVLCGDKLFFPVMMRLK